MNTYYETCAIPKPKKTKKKILYNGYKDKPDRRCRFCGAPYAERHEIFSGANRQICIKERFQIDVCPQHHRELQDNITPWAQEQNARLRKACQKLWEEKKIKEGYPEDRVREMWIGYIGRNYL